MALFLLVIVSTNGTTSSSYSNLMLCENTLADVVEEVMHKSSLSAATSNESTQEEKKEKKILYPIKGVPYTLDINLREGANLIAKDLSGTSDPYVKFRYNNKLLYKSATIYRDLRPRWYEKFSLNIEDVSKFLYLKVYDYDFALKDDFMGEAYVDMATLELEKITEIKLKLEDPNAAGKDLGYLLLTLTLTPKREMKEAKSKSLISTLTRGKSKKKIETSGVVDITTKKPRSQHSCDCVLNVVLLEGKNLMAMDDNGKSDPYCKLRIGNEKFKSKTCSKTLNPVWKEEYEFHIYYDQTTIFELEVYDYDMASKDDFMGKVELDVLALPKEDTVRMELELEGGEGLILLLLTLTGFNDGNNMTDEDLAGKEVTDPKRIEDLEDKYALSKTFKDKADIGYLIMKVIRAKELPAADFGGNSDPFVIAEVRNRRIQTPTVYKTINPEWGKVYQFGIKDIHDIVKISVYDEDKAKKEFLGKCMIPLLDVESGVRKWHNLKDRKFRDKAKGQIEIEMTVVYNPIRAALRTFKPREEYFLEEEIKFKRQLLVRNLKRVGGLVKAIVSFGGSIKDLFEWKRKSRSAIAFMIYIFICLNFDWFFLPVMLLITFAYHYIKYSLMGSAYFDLGEEEEEDDDDEETEDANKKGKESKSLKAKLQALYDVCQTVQNVLNKVASFGERVKNTFNWTVPWLSMLMVIVLSIVTVIFYIIPIRYIFLAWGIKKFTRKIIKPNHIPNNELMDFLSRIPSDEELILLRDSSVQDEKDTKKKR
ncbi:uncharacterized protein TRIADDRAFT_60419 [Trichoplax adhaerens]|uniref:C2 domain-containing protein n=1 Tax=Trichoplax adhaerens TaxID=10228 RepID=B3S861_TRIAD|nr:hypothetical protein TRIADDRAFT_60419 [Trichoplax adhaerens]EDV21046.1 hypothetical protein TRIADDRAFT_60419 [Trichoplax adhaerens]|eukprot:XP_002116376.1 hypothetical protein TRIADDRAFT_60419 [Trichoplax adhaerens]